MPTGTSLYKCLRRYISVVLKGLNWYHMALWTLPYHIHFTPALGLENKLDKITHAKAWPGQKSEFLCQWFCLDCQSEVYTFFTRSATGGGPAHYRSTEMLPFSFCWAWQDDLSFQQNPLFANRFTCQIKPLILMRFCLVELIAPSRYCAILHMS